MTWIKILIRSFKKKAVTFVDAKLFKEGIDRCAVARLEVLNHALLLFHVHHLRAQRVLLLLVLAIRIHIQPHWLLLLLLSGLQSCLV